MNKENLYKLKKLSRNLSILYIEDDLILQKQVCSFLEKLFDVVYTSLDGEDGLEQYKNKKPDIVLSSLVIPKKDGFDMIVDIKGENPDAKIVILSEHNEDLELLQTIDMGIVDFMIKPLDINSLLDSLLVAISQIQKQDVDTRCIEDLRTVLQERSETTLLSSYKGIAIRKDGDLKEVQDDEFTINVPYGELIAMKYSQKTIINLKSLDKYIEANVFDIDINTMNVTLINPHYISFKLMQLQQKRVKIDKAFQIGVHIHNEALEAKVIDISFTSITFYIDDLDSGLKLNDRIDLTLGVEIDGVSSLVIEKRFAKVFSQGQIIKIEPFQKGYKVLSLLKVQKASQRILRDYLKQRELEIIQEFRHIIKG